MLLYGGSVLIFSTPAFEPFPSYLWQTLIFLNLCTIGAFYFLLKAVPSSFVQLYLLTTVLKLFAYCAYNVAIILQDRPNAGVNVGFFLIAYVLFTTLELVFLYRRISQ